MLAAAAVICTRSLPTSVITLPKGIDLTKKSSPRLTTCPRDRVSRVIREKVDESGSRSLGGSLEIPGTELEKDKADISNTTHSVDT